MGGGELTELPVIEELNTHYVGVQKRSIWNTSSATDGLLYFLLPATGTTFTNNQFKLVVCDMYHVLNEFVITTRGTYGNGGAVVNGHLGIITNTSNRGYYVYCWTYDISTNTLTAGRQIATSRNYQTGLNYAFVYNGSNYFCSTLNRSRNTLTVVNMDNGQVQAQEKSFQDYVQLFYNNSGDQSYPFLGANLTIKYYNVPSRPLVIRKYAFPPINDGTMVSNSIATSNFSDWAVANIVKFYDIDDYFFITIDSKYYLMKGVFNHIEIGNVIPSGYAMTHMNLASGYGYFYNNSTYGFERYKISDFFNW